jgi:FkbM family methyltransferase
MSILNHPMAERLKRKIAIATNVYLSKLNKTSSMADDYRCAQMLNYFNIEWVIDIGSNIGEEALSLIDFGYTGSILSFEPIAKVHQQLSGRSKAHQNWNVAERCAIGNKNQLVKLNVSENTIFSSIKDIADWHMQSRPDSRVVHQEEVKMYRLDDILPNYLDYTRRFFLKIDVQGYEEEVIEGAGQTIKKAQGVKIEVPLKPTYENVTWRFNEWVRFFDDNDFYPYSLNPINLDKTTGIVSLADITFFKKQS